MSTQNIQTNETSETVFRHSKWGECVRLTVTNFLQWEPQAVRILKTALLYKHVVGEDPEPTKMVYVILPAMSESTSTTASQAGPSTRRGQEPNEDELFTIDNEGVVRRGQVVKIDTNRRIQIEQINPAYKEWEKRASEAYGLLVQILSTITQHTLAECQNAIELWRKINTIFGPGANLGIASRLHFKFMEMKIRENENVQQWIARLRPIQQQLENTEYSINDKIFRDKLLTGLTERWRTSVDTIWSQLASDQNQAVTTQHIID